MAVIVRTQEMAVLDTLRGVQRKYGKKYCFPSQETILRLLERIHGIKVCRRTLNYWLKRLVERKLIHRIKRHRRELDRRGNPTGPLQLNSTAYYLCDKVSQGVSRAKKIIGYAKRLCSLWPSRVQKTALNTFNPQYVYGKDLIGGGPDSGPSHDYNKGLAVLKSFGLKMPTDK